MFQPFFLNFFKVHVLATNFFLQMWNESGAAVGDFTRVVALVRSQYVDLSVTSNRINVNIMQSEGRTAPGTCTALARDGAGFLGLRVSECA
jgi:hypothetical protein